MDFGAELTLQIVWRAQTHARPDGARSPESWLFWPRGERVDWEGARAMLGALPKPLLVAPLLEPGMLGLWTADALDEPCRQVVARGIANQVQYYADKLTAIGVEQGPVRFGSETSTYEMSREGFLDWAAEYATFLRADSLDPGSPDPTAWMAGLYDYLGRHEESLRMREREIAMIPTNGPAYEFRPTAVCC